MNYEWEIQKLELELKHMREMNGIYRERVNAHEQGLEYTGNRLDRVESSLERLEAALAEQTKNVDKLVAVLLREHPNGGNGQ